MCWPTRERRIRLCDDGGGFQIRRCGRRVRASAPHFAFAVYETTFSSDFRARVRELQEIAREADEPLSMASLRDMFAFLSETPFTRRPALFLLDNGNFRVAWKNEDLEQVALQFRGDSVVHCVFFYKRDSETLPLSRETLVDLAPEITQRRPEFAHVLTDAAYEPEDETGG